MGTRASFWEKSSVKQRQEQRRNTGSLHCAADDTTIRCFGREDKVLGWFGQATLAGLWVSVTMHSATLGEGLAATEGRKGTKRLTTVP